MYFQSLFVEMDSGIYNLNMIVIYITVMLIAFIISVIISKKLNIYGKKSISFTDTSMNTKEMVRKRMLLASDEAALTSDTVRGDENE